MPMPSLRHVAALVLVTGCADLDTDVTTSPTAHESPPAPPAPLQHIVGGRYLGGTGLDVIEDVDDGDLDGNFYVVGGTSSIDFPVTVGATLDVTAPADCPACPFDGFVASVSRTGALRWARLIQTGGHDRLHAIEVDGDDVWVAGSAGDGLAAGFHGGADPQRGAQDGVLCHLRASDGELVGCRYVGGNGPGGVSDLAVSHDLGSGATRVALVMPTVAGEDLHLDPAYATAFAGAHRGTSTSDDIVVLSFARDLGLQWATYAGGSGAERGTPSVESDHEHTFVLTETTSDDAPAPRGLDGTRAGSSTDAYLAIFRDDGATLHYGSYLGGSADEHVRRNSLFGDRFALYVGLDTSSTDMPQNELTQNGTFAGDGGTDCGAGDVWIAGLHGVDLDGVLSLGANTYLGGAQGERFGGFASMDVDAFLGEELLVTFETHSPGLMTRSAAQPQFAGAACAPGAATSSDAYVATLRNDLGLVHASYLGSAGGDGAIGVRQSGSFIAVVGQTDASGIPMPTPFDPTYNGSGDGFLTTLHPDPVPSLPGDGGPGPGPGADPDAGPPDGYDESAGCCGAATPAGGSLGLALLTLALAGARRRRRA